MNRLKITREGKCIKTEIEMTAFRLRGIPGKHSFPRIIFPVKKWSVGKFAEGHWSATQKLVHMF